MGLREKRIISEVHPWLGVRLEWLQEVASIIGSGQLLISGNRSRSEQWVLYQSTSARPVAYPGCSQHQYGFAADASWIPAVTVTSKGRLKTFGQQETIKFMSEAARSVGLTTVVGDSGHVQIYAGSQFKAWAVARGLCNPNPPPRVNRLALLELEAIQDRLTDELGLSSLSVFGSSFFTRGFF